LENRFKKVLRKYKNEKYLEIFEKFYKIRRKSLKF